VFVTQISGFFKQFNNPADSAYPWCNGNRKICTTLSLGSNTNINRKLKDFDKRLFLFRQIRGRPGTKFSVSKATNFSCKYNDL
jgi:hypothetical protein